MMKILASLLLLAAGFACGAAAFVDTQARPLLDPPDCRRGIECQPAAPLLGLLASAGLHLAPGALPDIVGRNSRCVGIRSPKPEARVDLVFFPTRDLRDLLDVTAADQPYVMDCLALMRQVAAERGLSNWKIVTNGPGYQEIAYLHFHLMSQ